MTRLIGWCGLCALTVSASWLLLGGVLLAVSMAMEGMR